MMIFLSFMYLEMASSVMVLHHLPRNEVRLTCPYFPGSSFLLFLKIEVAYATSVFGQEKYWGNYRQEIFISTLGKMMEFIHLEIISKLTEEKVIGISHSEFLNGKSCLTHLVSLLQ